MAFHPPVHREFVLALRILDAFGMPYAEAWRLLRPVSARLRIPRPSYSSARRILIAERERKRRQAEELDELLAALFSGRFPYVTVEHKLVGLGPSAGPRPPPPRGRERRLRRLSLPGRLGARPAP